MNQNLRLVTVALLAIGLLLAPAAGIAQDKPKTPATGQSPGKPASSRKHAPPFRGTVTAVDKSAKTVTLGKRVFHISPETKLTKADQPATFEAITVGEHISGNYTKGGDGKLTAQTVRIGSKPADKPGKKKKPASEKPAAPQQ